MAGQQNRASNLPDAPTNLLTPGRISFRARRDSLEEDDGSTKWSFNHSNPSNNWSDRSTEEDDDEDEDEDVELLKPTSQISNVALAAALNNASRETKINSAISPPKGPTALAAAARATRFPLRSVPLNQQREGVTFTYTKSAPSTPRAGGNKKYPSIPMQQVAGTRSGNLQFTKKKPSQGSRSIKFTPKSRSKAKTIKGSHSTAQHHYVFRNRRPSTGTSNSTHIKFNNKRSQSQKPSHSSTWSRTPAYGNTTAFPPVTPRGRTNNGRRTSTATPSVGIRYSS